MTIKSVKFFFLLQISLQSEPFIAQLTLANGKWQKSGTGRGGGGISGNCPFKEVNTNKSCLVSPVVGDNTRRGEAATDKKAVSSDER